MKNNKNNDKSSNNEYLLRIRSRILVLIRTFFNTKGFTEVETPLLVRFPDPSPYHDLLKIGDSVPVYLAPSPEIYLKKYLSTGWRNIYQITKAFRTQVETDPIHLTEFTILEWYQDKSDYHNLMGMVERLFFAIEQGLGLVDWEYNGIGMELKSPWPRISCKDAFTQYASVDLDLFLIYENAKETCLAKGYSVNNLTTWEQMYHQVFLNEVEPELTKIPAVFLYDYPALLGEYAKLTKDGKYAERFELYLGGLEIGNGYSEVESWDEQERRFTQAQQERKSLGKEVFGFDYDLIELMKKTRLPKTAGIGIGIDRLVMIFTGAANIRKVAPYNL